MANDACFQTIPRTINTGLGALFILVALYLLGGDTLTDFALALLIGILVGTYSSVFTATPLAVWFERRAGRRHGSTRSPDVRDDGGVVAPIRAGADPGRIEPAGDGGPAPQAAPQAGEEALT